MLPGRVILADFGFCQRFANGICADDFCGSVPYEAPEIACGIPYTEKVDIWSCGITMYVCLTRRLPFHWCTGSEIIDGMMNGEDSDACKDLLNWMLDSDPEARPSAVQALEHG
jgi:calcium/calmodulin-dependent protein kinase (CaM kinase) II/calcium/calmodulin-dependent protein kinase I